MVNNDKTDHVSSATRYNKYLIFCLRIKDKALTQTDWEKTSEGIVQKHFYLFYAYIVFNIAIFVIY